MLNELAGLRLIKRQISEDCPYLEVDRSLQLALLLKFSNDSTERQTAFGRVVNLLKRFFLRPPHLQQVGMSSWTVTRKIIPHLLQSLAVLNFTQFHVQPSLLFVELLVDVSQNNIIHRGFVGEARTFLTKAEETLYTLRIPIEDTIYMDVFTLLGLCADMSGISERAQGFKMRQNYLQLCERGLAAIPPQQRTTPQEIKITRAKMNKAYSLQHLNHFSEVAEICAEYYSQQQKWNEEFRQAHDWLKYKSLMAYFYLFAGDSEKAILYAKEAYDLIASKSADKNSSDELIAARYKFSWATIMFQTGQENLAIEEHRQILDLRIQNCSESRIPTLQSRLIIGIMYHLTGEYSQAEFVILNA